MPGRKNKSRPNKPKIYRPHLVDGEEEEGLQNGRYVQGKIAVVGPTLAFVRIPGEENNDVAINGNLHRNRALHGDVVIVEILDPKEWTPKLELHWDRIAELLGITDLGTAHTKEDIIKLINITHNKKLPKLPTVKNPWMQILLACHVPVESIIPYCERSGEVVKIVTRTGIVTTIGHLKQAVGFDYRPIGGFLGAHSIDNWMPSVRVPQAQCHPALLNQLDKHLFLINDIRFCEDANANIPPVGTLWYIGHTDLYDTWARAILIANNVRTIVQPFTNLPRSLFNKLDRGRQDLTDLMVFTIDPPNAADLDDAVSSQRLENGNFEVYVHIADVSHFVEEGTSTDNEDQARGTSVYLQLNGVVPMLPTNVIDCCSLNPGVERFAVSVRYEMTANGEVVDASEFMRTVIRSRVKLTYAQAQAIVDGKEWSEKIHCRIDHNDKMAIETSIRDLHRITQAIRHNRMHTNEVIDFNGGKPSQSCGFTINKYNGAVILTKKEEYQTQQLIEELAILTNHEAAKAIFKKFPECALLRWHGEPLLNKMHLLNKNLSLVGLDTDTSSRASLRNLLNQDDASFQTAAIKVMAIKAMKKAIYVRSGNDTFHYALGMEYYTHMTSPIRRYADIIVHRMLFSNTAPSNLDQMIDMCNDRKAGASACQDDSWSILMGCYLKQRPLLERAVVVGIIPAKFEVELLVVRFMIRQKICVGNKSSNRDPNITNCRHRFDAGTGKHMFDIEWSERSKTVSVWDEVTVRLEAIECDPRNFKVTLLAE